MTREEDEDFLYHVNDLIFHLQTSKSVLFLWCFFNRTQKPPFFSFLLVVGVCGYGGVYTGGGRYAGSVGGGCIGMLVVV